MRFATLCVLDDTGGQVWSGSAMSFIRNNAMDRFQVMEMAACLRGVPGMPPEPYVMGGGAAPLAYVSLVEPEAGTGARRVEREFCPYCDASNFPEYTRCIACGLSPTGVKKQHTPEQLYLIDHANFLREARAAHRAAPGDALFRDAYMTARAALAFAKSAVRARA